MNKFIESCEMMVVIIGLPCIVLRYLHGAATGNVNEVLSVYPLLYSLVGFCKLLGPLKNLSKKALQKQNRGKGRTARAKRPGPPAFAEEAVKLSMPKRVREPILGDLQQDWLRRCEESGKHWANWWYWRQACYCLANAAKTHLRRKIGNA